MSELKAFTFCLGRYTEDGYPCVVACDDEGNPRLASDETFYLKSEADKVIAYHKYKRCLAMAKWCSAELGMLVSTWESKIKYYKRWQNRWLKLAEKFKEAK